MPRPPSDHKFQRKTGIHLDGAVSDPLLGHRLAFPRWPQPSTSTTDTRHHRLSGIHLFTVRGRTPGPQHASRSKFPHVRRRAPAGLLVWIDGFDHRKWRRLTGRNCGGPPDGARKQSRRWGLHGHWFVKSSATSTWSAWCWPPSRLRAREFEFQMARELLLIGYRRRVVPGIATVSLDGAINCPTVDSRMPRPPQAQLPCTRSSNLPFATHT